MHGSIVRPLVPALLAALLAGPSNAADRALLIGVGDYAAPNVSDLPGIDLDVAIMQRVAARLGFDAGETRVLSDAEATLGGVDRAMREWLVDGVAADDRVLIYFSGHGSQVSDRNGDESDGLDEILVLHDYSPTPGANGVVPGALVDDRFFQMLSEIPTDDVLLVVDACHSGTGFKSVTGSPTGADSGVSKSHASGLVPRAGGDTFAVAEKGSGARFAALMAAADDEVAIATERGSMFTLGVERAIEQAAASGGSITPRQVVRESAAFVASALPPSSVFTPQLGGSAALADKPLRLASNNPVRDAVEEMVAGHPPLAMGTNKATYSFGDRSLRVAVDVPTTGYLNIVTVDPDGTALVLFPNQFNADNRVDPGELAVPTPQMNFDLSADGPAGEHLIAAFWTAEPLDLYQAGFGTRDADGKLLEPFAELSEFGSRSFTVVERESRVPPRTGKVVVEMRP